MEPRDRQEHSSHLQAPQPEWHMAPPTRPPHHSGPPSHPPHHGRPPTWPHRPPQMVRPPHTHPHHSRPPHAVHPTWPHRPPHHSGYPMRPSRPPQPPPPPRPPEFPTGIDYGAHPYVVDIGNATLNNDNFRATLWTGKHLQLTVMSIGVGEDIGLEQHPHVDQFLRIEEGQAMVMMGEHSDQLTFKQPAFNDFAIFVPAGMWHNIINTGRTPLKLYSIYAPPNHPKGTVHATKAIAEKMEGH